MAEKFSGLIIMVRKWYFWIDFFKTNSVISTFAYLALLVSVLWEIKKMLLQSVKSYSTPLPPKVTIKGTIVSIKVHTHTHISPWRVKQPDIFSKHQSNFFLELISGFESLSQPDLIHLATLTMTSKMTATPYHSKLQQLETNSSYEDTFQSPWHLAAFLWFCML